VLARWLGWLAVVLGVVAAIPSHVLGGALDHIGVLPVAGLALWTLVVSVLLVRRADAERYADAVSKRSFSSFCGTFVGYSRVKHARQTESSGSCVACCIPSTER
jgi:hypothetical protein